MPDYIICYDIANPRRLGRIHRAIKKYATPLQYSVFWFSGSPAQLERCLARLHSIMDTRQDDIRAYPLPERGLRWTLGPSALPDGILLASMPPPADLPDGCTPPAPEPPLCAPGERPVLAHNDCTHDAE